MSAKPACTAPTVPRHPWADGLLILVFAVLIWLPTADSFTGMDITRQPSENRALAPKPRLNRLDFPGVQSYAAATELYFNDHFGFRKRLIRWFHQWKTRLFHDESAAAKSAFAGQHGWLFFAQQEMIEHYLGTAKFSTAQLRAWQTLLEKRRDWLAVRGIQYLFIIPPDKHNIYPEELPTWLQNAAPTNRETKLDQFLQYMKTHSTVPILDLRQPLLKAKAVAPTYLQTDTHWNAFGAFIACQEVIKTLTRQFPDLPPLRLEDFTWTNAPTAGGDLDKMLGSDVPEKNNFVFTPKPAVVVPMMSVATNLVLRWNMRNTNAISVIAENPAPLAETAVVFHDSYFGKGGWFRLFFGCSFKRVLYVWENREFNPQIIMGNRPRLVVSEMLERFFNTYDPEELMAKEALVLP
jgi:hypothetical protein